MFIEEAHDTLTRKEGVSHRGDLLGGNNDHNFTVDDLIAFGGFARLGTCRRNIGGEVHLIASVDIVCSQLFTMIASGTVFGDQNDVVIDVIFHLGTDLFLDMLQRMGLRILVVFTSRALVIVVIVIPRIGALEIVSKRRAVGGLALRTVSGLCAGRASVVRIDCCLAATRTATSAPMRLVILQGIVGPVVTEPLKSQAVLVSACRVLTYALLITVGFALGFGNGYPIAVIVIRQLLSNKGFG